jgi:predicted metal-dependent enzyme (double-stranded beta helix superfamily)
MNTTSDDHIDSFRGELLDSIRIHRGNAKATAMNVRDQVREALADDDFIATCWRRTIACMRSDPLWYRRALIESYDPLVNVHLIFWPPEFRNNPHRHNTWSVTGVVHNAVSVRTFHFLGDEASTFVQDRCLGGKTGEVGYLLPSCIHSVSNETELEACTLHVFGGEDDNGVVDNHTIWYPSRGNGEISRGARARAIRVMTQWAAARSTPQALDLLVECCEVADVRQTLDIVKLLSVRDPQRSYAQSLALEQRLNECDRERLGAINRELAKALA